jgi:Tol biopolymer transport system component
MNRGRRLCIALVCGGCLLTSGSAHATSLSQRTFLLGAGQGGIPNDASANPGVSPSGGAFAFDSAAFNLTRDDGNGGIRDVYRTDTTGAVALISRGLGGAASDGPSTNPVLAADGQTIAFASRASNLVLGDANGRSDIFVRTPENQIVRVSAGLGGREANGDSFQPDISADGRFVAFRSIASNLVANDFNRTSDVFVRDLALGRTTLVSAGPLGRTAGGASINPAISSTGRFVSFTSSASNLVGGDRNRRADVFVRDLRLHGTALVSLSSGRLTGPRRAAQQNASILIAPFTQVSDVSASGRYVTFDSDATNLIRGDFNRSTDVFVRDRALGITSRASISTSGLAGNQDSFFPSMTPDARYVAFQSFASNLAPGGSPREDVFVRDRTLAATSVVDVGASGQPAQPPAGPQLLQRPSLSNDAHVVAFTSKAPNLVGGDANGVADAFVRVMTPATTGLIKAPRGFTAKNNPNIIIGTDDPQATTALCRIDARRRLCPLGFRLTPQADGRHLLIVRAGGPGLLFDPVGTSASFTVRPVGPFVRPVFPGLGAQSKVPVRLIRGTATNRGAGVARVELWVAAAVGKALYVFNGRALVRSTGVTPVWVRARGGTAWSLPVASLKGAFFFVRIRAFDSLGRVGPIATLPYFVV